MHACMQLLVHNDYTSVSGIFGVQKQMFRGRVFIQTSHLDYHILIDPFCKPLGHDVPAIGHLNGLAMLSENRLSRAHTFATCRMLRFAASRALSASWRRSP